uniref:Growth-regulating factor n=1 Tax=Aegilops tauschii subsp. strangulata TaxID=200361 RepID=A0A453PRW6_AEGTS
MMMMGGRAGAGGVGAGGGRCPFTATQWQELEHQALIYKYMASGVPIPSDLLLPLRRSFLLDSALATSPSLAFPPQLAGVALAWGSAGRRRTRSRGGAGGRTARSGAAPRRRTRTPSTARSTCTAARTVQESLWKCPWPRPRRRLPPRPPPPPPTSTPPSTSPPPPPPPHRPTTATPPRLTTRRPTTRSTAAPTPPPAASSTLAPTTTPRRSARSTCTSTPPTRTRRRPTTPAWTTARTATPTGTASRRCTAAHHHHQHQHHASAGGNGQWQFKQLGGMEPKQHNPTSLFPGCGGYGNNAAYAIDLSSKEEDEEKERRQQQQHCFLLGADLRLDKPSSGHGDSADQKPLRPFFDEWPHEKTGSKGSWMGLEGETQLSISIANELPITTTSRYHHGE